MHVIECVASGRQSSHVCDCCAAATAAAARAAQQEEDLQASASGAAELDEFGRDANMAKRQEAAQRRQRRAQRLQAHADRPAASQVCALAFCLFKA